MLVKNDFDDLIYEASEAYDVPFTWIKAIAGAESDWIPTAYRAEPRINDASYGLMQVLYKTAYSLGYRGDPEGLYDPAININLGAKLLQELRARWGDDFRAVYSAYNSGGGNNYKTNPDVASHVDRALRYLDAVNQVTSEVTAGDDGNGSFGVVAALALLAGVVLFFFRR